MSIDRTSALKPVSAVQPRETNDAPAQKTRLEKPSTSNSTSVTLSDAQVDEMFALVKANPGIKFEVDLEAQVVKAGDKTYSFKIDDFRRHCMLNGLDSIGLTLQHEAAISDYERKLPVFMN